MSTSVPHPPPPEIQTNTTTPTPTNTTIYRGPLSTRGAALGAGGLRAVRRPRLRAGRAGRALPGIKVKRAFHHQLIEREIKYMIILFYSITHHHHRHHYLTSHIPPLPSPTTTSKTPHPTTTAGLALPPGGGGDARARGQPGHLLRGVHPQGRRGPVPVGRAQGGLPPRHPAGD